jgi:beta-alanine--pyruvate transaminase
VTSLTDVLTLSDLCSGHPLAMAAGIASLEVFQEQKIFENAASLAPYWEEKVHSLKGLPHVVDIRNVGMMGAVEVAPASGPAPSARAQDIFDRVFEKGVLLRFTGNTIPMSPPLVSEKKHLDQIIDVLRESINESATHFKG